jgi:hypothetical protein
VDYNEIVLDALQVVLEEYKRGEILFLTESDLQSHLFCKCIGLMKQRGLSFPFQIHAEKDVFEKRSKIDLVLGDNEVLVELKFEPESKVGGEGRVFTTIKGAGGLGYGSVEEDLKKIRQYAKKGKHGHFLMIDETGYHARNIVLDKWISVKTVNRQVYLLHVHAKPT